MLENPGAGEPAGESIDDFEWVNAWAERGAALAARRRPASITEPYRVHLLASAFAADAGRAAAALDERHSGLANADQLVLDIAAIEPARDALLAASRDAAPPPWFALRRTSDSVPLILGFMLGMLMLVIFSIAAAFIRLAR